MMDWQFISLGHMMSMEAATTAAAILHYLPPTQTKNAKPCMKAVQ